MAGTRNLDLHLLTALDHLLRERSVTAAARRLGVSQPSMSASLARLRRHFGDDLLVRRDGGYVLTPLASVLAERTPGTLAEVRGLLDISNSFDLATTTREFHFVVSDHFTSLYGAATVDRIRRDAPHATVRFSSFEAITLDDFPGHLMEADGVMLPRASIPDYPFVDIARDDWVLVVARSGVLAERDLTLDDLGASSWVAFRLAQGGQIPPITHLHSQGLETSQDVLVNSFTSVPFLVAGSDRIGVLPRRLATLLADVSGTVVKESPVPLPSLMMAMLWHPAHELDPAHVWLRAVMADLGVS